MRLGRYTKIAFMLVLALSASEAVAAESSIEALAGKWDVECAPRGCLMYKDEFIGLPNDHPKDPENYAVTITVAIERMPARVAYISFQAPANATKAKGLGVAFSKSKAAGQSWNDVLKTVTWLPFADCDATACRVQLNGGIAPDGTNILEQFATQSVGFFAFERDGQVYSTSTALFAFVRDYNAARAQLAR